MMQPMDTPTRRSALRFSITAFAAGLTAPVRAGATAATATNPDADLIALCAIVMEKEAARQALHDLRHTLTDEHRTEPALQALYAAGEHAVDRMMILPGPSTMEGLQAMARASLAIAPRDWNGGIIPQGDAEWLAFGVVTFLAKAAAI